MSNKLVRFLSTGRAGTKFIASVFLDQGYSSFHEDLYVGEPSSAIKMYTNMLGDLWNKDKEEYFSFESNFAKPYIRSVERHLASLDQPETSGLLARFKKKEQKNKNVLIHTAHLLTTVTPLIEKELNETNIVSRNLILFRNPLKTIHALFMVESGHTESQRPYRMRPVSFSQDSTFIGAANIWVNTYRLAHDQSQQLDSTRFRKMSLERFSSDPKYAAKIFEFLGLNFSDDRFKDYVQKTLSSPLRSAKINSARNSHIFHDPDFSFSKKDISKIYSRIKEVVQIYDIDWQSTVDEYVQFHSREKSELGFDGKS